MPFFPRSNQVMKKTLENTLFYKRNGILLPFLNLFTDVIQIYCLKSYKSIALLSGLPIIFPVIGAGVWTKYYGDTKRLF